MIIKKGDEIEVTFNGTALEDVESMKLMEWLMDEVCAATGIRVQNPGYRDIKKSGGEND